MRLSSVALAELEYSIRTSGRPQRGHPHRPSPPHIYSHHTTAAAAAAPRGGRAGVGRRVRVAGAAGTMEALQCPVPRVFTTSQALGSWRTSSFGSVYAVPWYGIRLIG